MTKILKSAIITLLALTALGVSAQTETRWGVTAGGSYNEIHFKQNKIINTDRGFGPFAGVTGEMNIPGIGFSVDASLFYAMRTGKIHYGEHKAWSSLGYDSENCQMHSIDVPLNLKFKYHYLNGLEDKLMPMVFFGPTFSFLVGKNLEKVNSYKPVSVHLHFGLGVELWRRVQIQGAYNFSIGETLRTKLLDENAAKNRFWTISATYYFK